MTPPRLFTWDEAAQHIGVSISTVKRLVDNGDLRAVDIATQKGGRRRLRIREDELARWIDKRTAETKTA